MSRAAAKSAESSKPKAKSVAKSPASSEQAASAASERLQGGSPLPTSTRDRMERSYGRSFGGVRVHTDAVASRVASDHGAEALTVGDKIAFGAGRFRPGTSGGDHLIAHELAHVAQQSQSGGGVVAQASSLTSNPAEPAEQAAEAAASAVGRGEKVTVSGASGLSTRQRIHRRALRGARRLPALSLSTPQPGARAKAGDAARGAPTAVTNSVVSPAGDRPVAAVGKGATVERGPDRKPKVRAPEQHSPDQAQAPIPDAGPSPVSALVSGASAGAGPEAVKPQAPGGKEGEKKKEKKAKGEKDGEKKEKGEKEKKKEEAGAGGGGGGRKKKERKFGQVPGDRGAGAAKAATQRLGERSEAMQHHEPAGERVAQARAAAVPPANEGSSRAQGQQVGTVAGSEPPAPDRASVSSEVKANVEAAAPSNMEEMGRMASSGATQRIGSQLTTAVGQQAAGVRGTLEQVNTPPAAQEPAPAVPQPEPEAAPSSATPALAGAAPPPVPEESLDASEFADDANAELASYDVDDETLNKAQDGPLAELAGQKRELDQAVETSGEQARAGEGPALEGARGELESEEGSADAEMASTRDSEQQGVVEEQAGTRTGEEGERGTVAQQIEDIYKRASDEVTGKLDGLNEGIETRFTSTQEQYLEDFGSETRRELEDFKDRRYSGATGWTKWLKDRFVSINELSDVKAIYSRNRERYISRIDSLIAEITGEVETTIQESKQILDDAKAEIEELVASLPADLQEEARQAQERVTQRFAALESRVADAEKQAKESLKRLRKQAIEAVDKELEKIKSENEALLDKLANFVKALAEALGKFMALMTRVTRMGVGSFIGNALSQAKDGIKNHLWGALQQAFKEWIFRKIPFLEPLMNLPPNWMDMLVQIAVSLPALFMQHLPSMLPAIGVAAMIWLATNLAIKLIPGAGAIMAVIDGIRAAWGLVQSLFSAAEAFFGFVMKVAQPANGAAQFALALARGIVAGLEAVLTFLGVDKLIMRVGKTVAKPFGKIFKGISKRLKKRKSKRKKDRRDARGRNRAQRGRGRGRSGTRGRRRRERSRRRNRRRQRRRRRRGRANQRRRPRRRTRSQRRNDRRRRREQRKMERWRKGMAALKRYLAKNQDRETRALVFRAGLALIRVRYRFKTLRLTVQGGDWVVLAGMSPADRVSLNRKVVAKDKIDPAYPEGLKGTRKRTRRFQKSNRGNTRLFAWSTEDTDQAWVWVAKKKKAKKGHWQPVAGKKKSEAVKKAEAAARKRLKSKKDEYVDLVGKKHENAPGFDVGGMGKRQGESERRVFIGEAKQSDAKRGRNFGLDKFTAITGSRLSKNFDAAEEQVRTQSGRVGVRHFRSALRSGQVTFEVFVSGRARVSKAAMAKLEAQILQDMRAFLKAKFPTLKKKDLDKAVKAIEIVPTPTPV